MFRQNNFTVYFCRVIMKRQGIVYTLLLVFLLFVGGNRLVFANSPTTAKVPVLPLSHTKHHHPAAGFTKNIDTSLTDVLFSVDAEEDAKVPVNHAESIIVFATGFIFAAFVLTLLIQHEKPDHNQLSPYAVGIKKFLLIRTLRI